MRERCLHVYCLEVPNVTELIHATAGPLACRCTILVYQQSDLHLVVVPAAVPRALPLPEAPAAMAHAAAEGPATSAMGRGEPGTK